MDDKQILTWLTVQMKQESSGGAIADVAKRVYDGTPLRKAVYQTRLTRLKRALRMWGQWKRVPYNGYPSMDTIGRARTYGMGGAPNFSSRPPKISRYRDVALERIDKLIKDLAKANPDQAIIIETHYVDPEHVVDRCEEKSIAITTWYRELSRGHDQLLEKFI